MATYKSRYAELGFYASGELRRFTLGEYKTEDPADIAVLDALADAERIYGVSPEESATVTKAPRKPSAKQSIPEDTVTSAK